jgi:hypothetical protein
MPIEIRELVIRTTVSDSGGSASESRSSGASTRYSAAVEQPDMQAIVEECVRQVLEILARRQER